MRHVYTAILIRINFNPHGILTSLPLPLIPIQFYLLNKHKEILVHVFLMPIHMLRAAGHQALCEILARLILLVIGFYMMT